MKKMYSLIRSCMTSDMKIFKLKTKKNNKIVPLVLTLYLMFMMYYTANQFMGKLSPTHLEYLVLAVLVFGISFMTIIEGIYKSGPLLFNCRDDELLFSLPIKKSTVLFIRIFKFYIFELLFNSIFILPVMIAYIKYASHLSYTYLITSFFMLLLLPIIPIIISCIIGFGISSLSSKFKYKNIIQILSSMLVLLGILYISYNTENIMQYFIKHASSLNDLIIKIYYPAGIYARLVTNFNVGSLLVFIFVNIGLFWLMILILSRFYFKVNSVLKKVETTKKVKIDKLSIKSHSVIISLIKKELLTFFKTPVLIINAGFALVLFMIAAITVTTNFSGIIQMITNSKDLGFSISKEILLNNKAIIILLLVTFASFMTSITNSLISLEGRNINILKSLPVDARKILMTKIYASLIITTPLLFVGDIIMFIILKISILQSLLLLTLSIIMPLLSHFIGLIINLKYPKLDAQNSTEVVKQSTSSLLSVITGFMIMFLLISILMNVIGKINLLLLLGILVIIFSVTDLIMYYYLTSKGVKNFYQLSI